MTDNYVTDVHSSRLQGRSIFALRSSALDRAAGMVRKVIVPVVIVVVWEAAARAKLIDPLLFASPSAIAHAFRDEANSGALMGNLLASMQRILAGFALATVVAVPLGMLLGVSARTREYLGGLFEFLRPVPPLALIPLTILWLGIGDGSKVTIIAYASFWPVLLNVTSGVAQIPVIIDQTAKTLNIRGVRRFIRILLPGSMPSIMTGMRVSLGIAIIVVVAAEMVAASSGLGYAVLQSERVFATPTMYCYIVMLSLLGVALNLALLLVEKRLTRWR